MVLSTTADCQSVSTVGVEAADRGYVALHGTGTPLGDPIEMGALGQALAATNKSATLMPQLAIGSVKSCYGHSEGAAGTDWHPACHPDPATKGIYLLPNCTKATFMTLFHVENFAIGKI